MESNILGVSSLVHDPAAVLSGDGRIIAAIEESKLVRTREVRGIPRTAIEFCLKKTQLAWKDLQFIAVGSDPKKAWARRALFRSREAIRAPFSSGYYQTKAIGDLARDLNNLRVLGILHGPEVPVLQFEHALCHAASAFYASPFENALILSLDEQGDGRCGLLAAGEGTQIRELRSVRFPNSLAWVYSQVTELLGFKWGAEEHKTQWLSLIGRPVFSDLFLEMLRGKEGEWPQVNSRYFRRGFTGGVAFSREFYRHVGIGEHDQAEIPQDIQANLAASVQVACMTIVSDLAESLRKEFAAKYLCLAGGLFLNPLMVADIEKNTEYEQIFVQPVSGNEGTALGAAYLASHADSKKPRSAPLTRLDLGPSYSNQEIKEVLDNCKTTYRWVDSDDGKIDEAVRRIVAGKIVAWYQGAAEFGPRALGNRCLFASPWAEYVKDNLNDYVKHREAYRPFALSVPEEDCSRYFQCTSAGRFMATLGTVLPGYQEMLKGFLLPGSRVRLHIVEKTSNPLLWRLLKRFGEVATAPLLVNTSFNLFGEPLVITPRDAVRSYFCSGTDALVAGNFVLSKD